MNRLRLVRPATLSPRWLLPLLLSAPPSALAAVYVNAAAPGPVQDGATWATAYRTVQAGVNAAQYGDEVWVAKGIYTGTLTISNDVALYGGFAGTETDRDQRDWRMNATILDAQKAGAVVKVNAAGQTATVDGFTIRNGSDCGINIPTGDAVIRNNTITGNRGANGGGICAYATGSHSVTITDNIVQGNQAYGGDGGGIAVEGTAVITGNTVSGNDAAYGGGGIWVTPRSIPAVIEANIVSGNSAYVGGGIRTVGDALVTRNTITGNTAHTGGGLEAFMKMTLANNVIANNSAVEGGGVFAAWSATVISNTICSNFALTGGGLRADSFLDLRSNIIAFNSAGVLLTGSNNKLYNNDAFGNDEYNYSGGADPTGQDGNISADPKLSGIYQGWHLEPGSPCIDAGDGAHITGAADVDGQDRVQGAGVDIGADESDGTAWPVRTARTWRVAPTGSDANDGTSWVQALRSVAAAAAAAQGGDEIWVAQGTYNAVVTLPNAVGLYGGFSGTETERSQRDPAAHPTILDGGKAGTALTVPGFRTVIDGLTIRNGSSGGIRVLGAATISHSTITGNAPLNDAGAIRVLGAATITRNTISGNSTVGISVEGKATIDHNIIRGNTDIQGSGGGINVAGTAAIENNLITANTCAYGGGIRVYQGNATVTNNTIVANTSASRGGAMDLYNDVGTVSLTNNIVAFNSLGIYAVDAAKVAWSHNDISGNGLYNVDGPGSPIGANGNISSDPLFANRAAGDFHLLPGSPCMDTADDSAMPAGTDLDGNPRPQGLRGDMGAYEYNIASRPFTVADAARALRIAGGTVRPTTIDAYVLNVESSAASAGIDLADALRLARKAAGLEANPF